MLKYLIGNDEKKSSSSQMDSNKVPQFPAPVVHPCKLKTVYILNIEYIRIANDG